jgi:hypothetical protein
MIPVANDSGNRQAAAWLTSDPSGSFTVCGITCSSDACP